MADHLTTSSPVTDADMTTTETTASAQPAEADSNRVTRSDSNEAGPSSSTSEILAHVETGCGDDTRTNVPHTESSSEAPAMEAAGTAHKNASTLQARNHEGKEIENLTGVRASPMLKRTAIKVESVTTQDMDVDVNIVSALDGPCWSDHERDDEDLLLPQPEAFQGRSTKTGYVYDVRMKHHNNVHGDDDHPEDPRRIWKIFDALNCAQCTDRMIKIPTREASVEELVLVHTENHIDNITKTADMTKDDLFAMANNYNSIYLNNLSAFCARLSCGSLIELCKAVALGQVLNGLAIIRPPGHHAEPDEAGGFCLYNNVAIAARYLQKCHGLQKIFILDWDVHHGNGTQSAFYDDPDVVYCSIHRFDHGHFYPGDPVAGAHTAIGEGPGRGRTINIPWNSSGMGDSEYIYAFHKVIIPIIYEFAPDFVLVSAGFDAAKGDHIGQMLVTPAAYGHMTHMLKSLAGGKIILALEGGYNLDSIAVSGLACAKALLNDPIEPLDPIVPNAECVQTIHEVIEVQSRYWKSLPQSYTDPLHDPIEDHITVGVDKILSAYRQSYLQERHDMIRMPKLESEHGNEFLDNVLCTQRTFSSKPLYIFVHDLSEEISIKTLGTSSALRSDKSIMVDTVSHYVDYIIGSGSELIDVAVPYQPISDEDKTTLKEKLTVLLAEIWDNYVSTTGYTGRRIILLAAGFGCHSVTTFMNERQKEVVKYVSCVTLVPGDDSLPMVSKKMGPWYLDNSFVILTDDHPYWERQKGNNRNGSLIRSEHSSGRLSELMKHLRCSIFEGIQSRLETLPPAPESDSDEDFKDEDPTDMETGEAKVREHNGEPKENALHRNTGTAEESLLFKTEEPLPYPKLSPSPILSAKAEAPVSLVQAHQSLTPPQMRSYPGSPVLNGSSIPRPISQPLVDRPSIMGQQHRAQPYPTPNGRSLNGSGNSSTATSSPNPLAMHPRSSTPQSRPHELKMTSELHEPRARSMVAPQYQSQHQQGTVDVRPQIEHQHREQHPPRQQVREALDHHSPSQTRPILGNSREESDHPYLHQGYTGNDKRIPTSRPITGASVGGSGPGDLYPVYSAASHNAAASPSTMAHPQSPYPPSTSMIHNSGSGSPRPPHSSSKANLPQQQPLQQHHLHHSSSGGGGPAYGSPKSSNSGNYRAGGGLSPIPPPGSSPAQLPFEPMHRHRGSYSSHGPPPALSSSNGQQPSQHQQQQHIGPPGPAGYRQHPGWSPQQQQQQQQIHQPSLSSSRPKRSDQEPDPYVSQFSPSHQQPKHHPPQQHYQDMERQRMMEMERQHWDMDQQTKHHKAQQHHQRMIDRGYEIHGQQSQHGHTPLHHQQQHLQQQSQSYPHSHPPHHPQHPPPTSPHPSQHHHPQHYEPMHDRGRPHMMTK